MTIRADIRTEIAAQLAAIGQAVRAERRRRGLRIADVAQATGLSEGTILALERRTASAKLASLLAVLRHFGLAGRLAAALE